MYASNKTLRQKREKVYNVETSDEYQIAKFDKDVVLNELRRGQPTPLRQLFKFSRKGFRRNILGQTMYFLLAYVFLHTLVQLAYQKNWFCSNEERPNEKNEKNETITPHKRCIARATAYFVHWDENARTLTSLITFLLGFYVTTIARRWWEQVSKLPDADNIVLILGGLVWTDSKPEAALKFKKTIIRYALLSWTMCLSQISSPLRHKFLTDEKYIEKGLLTKEEAIALKIDPNDPDCTSQWWIPISWAIAMVNKTFNEKEKTDILIPKDHKDVVSVLIKFRENLHLIAEYTLRPLPAIYKQAVWSAVFGWMLMGVSANQNTIHHKDAEKEGSHMAMIILLGFPVYGILMYMLIFGWLRVANILNNPWGKDELYDINLSAILDFNIWKSSITLEDQEKAVACKFLVKYKETKISIE